MFLNGFCRARSPCPLSSSFVEDIESIRARRGIYSLAVVVWLMIYQRLNRKSTLSAAVQFLAREGVIGHSAPRAENGRVSGGFPVGPVAIAGLG
jgi:hypothetical protein